ncbi:MAG: undecaprenyldiphospho-muramoylpentapeptide beta-N-acetylglucosaminyltransferase [Terriglobia bacterium]
MTAPAIRSGAKDLGARFSGFGIRESGPDAVHRGVIPDSRAPGPECRTSSLRVLVAAGGTGGHIFPALTVAQALRERWTAQREQVCDREQPEIEFVGTGRGIESRVIPAAGFPLHVIAAAGLKGMGPSKWIRNLFVLPASFWEAGKLLMRFRPDVVVGLGGYVAGPVMLEASLARIPTLLIEPNAAPGFTNRVLAPWIRLAAVGFPEGARFYGSKARVTGHPVRPMFARIAPKTHEPPFTLLISGGSQGSLGINNATVRALPLLARQAIPCRIIHQTGERDFERVRAAYQNSGLAVEVHAFLDDIPAAFERADLVVCRSGASTVSEIMAAGKASLLIPFPAAADNHQLANARILENVGAARVIEQRHLTPQRLVEEICSLLAEPDKLVQMDHRARALARPDAAAQIAELVERLASSP